MSGGPPVNGLRVALAAGSCLALLAMAVSQGWLAWLDDGLLSSLATWRSPFLDGFFRAITWFGSGYVLIPAVLLLLAVLAARRQWLLAGAFGLIYSGAALSAWALKQIIGRERPLLHPALAEFIRVDWSFPSGHATHAAAFALGAWLLARSCGRAGSRLPTAGMAMVLLLAMVLLVALSRLYLQVHWPSDVLAGILLAAVWAGVVIHALQPGALQGGRP